MEITAAERRVTHAISLAESLEVKAESWFHSWIPPQTSSERPGRGGDGGEPRRPAFVIGVGDQLTALKATSPGISRPLFWVLLGTAGTGNFLSLLSWR